jgi:hypothetical protein
MGNQLITSTQSRILTDRLTVARLVSKLTTSYGIYLSFPVYKTRLEEYPELHPVHNFTLFTENSLSIPMWSRPYMFSGKLCRQFPCSMCALNVPASSPSLTKTILCLVLCENFGHTRKIFVQISASTPGILGYLLFCSVTPGEFQDSSSTCSQLLLIDHSPIIPPYNIILIVM